MRTQMYQRRPNRRKVFEYSKVVARAGKGREFCCDDSLVPLLTDSACISISLCSSTLVLKVPACLSEAEAEAGVTTVFYDLKALENNEYK